MTKVSLWDREGKEIRDWRSWTRPKRDHQWQMGRSAMELARAWFTCSDPHCPPEICSLLSTHETTSGFDEFRGHPERITGLCESGGGRNHDLLLKSSDGKRTIIVSVEAKVDETFGELVGKYWRRKKSDTGSGLPRRIECLLEILFGSKAKPDQNPWQKLRYQLVTALASTAIETAKAGLDVGVLVIHELHTSVANEQKLAKNAEDLASLIFALSGEVVPTDVPKRLFGPFSIPPSEHVTRGVHVLIGRAVYDWRASPGAA